MMTEVMSYGADTVSVSQFGFRQSAWFTGSNRRLAVSAETPYKCR
jgi:hypothetical protein